MYEDFDELPELLLAANYINCGTIDRRRVDGDVITTLELEVYERDSRVLDFPDYIVCYHREVKELWRSEPIEVLDMQLPYTFEYFKRTAYYQMLQALL